MLDRMKIFLLIISFIILFSSQIKAKTKIYSIKSAPLILKYLQAKQFLEKGQFRKSRQLLKEIIFKRSKFF